MQLTVIAGFGVGDIDTSEIEPAVLEIAVEPERGRVVDEILLGHAIGGNFRCTAEPIPGRFRIAVGQYSDLDRLEEALAEIAALEYDETSYNAVNIYTVRDLVSDLRRQREEAVARKETDTIEDEIATGIYGEGYLEY
ncbi:hypothetical protein FGU65_14100 [Methanoculleus sp. FWC-SCC1]|uniref:SPOR domain-containing protein n=1 Tax=Methanoculleus frigidifontis TaxID=2584085 RepID=A0ABT8MDI1_9EURY|nr:hypothetical protein [Methanoculleus sp. FWC-SCC1]MDN7026003.1 hypothetical protein [Methanoculleus sp. FWC-SCC1]